MAPTPGILYVTMQPSSALPASHFHDWYNNEHGPTRLRLPFIEHGFRYRATDLKAPGTGTDEMSEWMAVYDITDMEELTRETYLRLRGDEVKSQREKDTMRQIKVGRKLYDLVAERRGPGFKKLEEVGEADEGNVLVAGTLTLKEEKDGKELDRWYDEEHIGLMAKVPGWLRTRRFVTSSILGGKEGMEYLALHEYTPKNGLGGEEFKAATSTPWCNEILTNIVQEMEVRIYELYYTFGAAPRHLAEISDFTSPDGQTKTMRIPPGDGRAIESFVTTEDGVVLPYRLEGSSKPDAPCLILSNSILVDWGIWDPFISSFSSFPQNQKYRIIRYLTRGRSSNCGNPAITVDVLASDIIALLDALRIPQAAALIGVSLGGATVLSTALKYPDRVAAFVSCDTSSKSPEGNKKAWGERIVVAEKEEAKAQNGERVVGEQLAEATVRRWFVKKSYDGGDVEKRIGDVKAMVENNSLEGFKKSVQALFEYDLRAEMKNSRIPGAFVVGGGDGALPGTMKDMAAAYGTGAEYVVMEGAGHLPMVEKPEEFAQMITKFLGNRS